MSDRRRPFGDRDRDQEPGPRRVSRRRSPPRRHGAINRRGEKPPHDGRRRRVRQTRNIDDELASETPEKKEIYNETGVKSRNKRLFSNLLGHLSSARSNLERDASLLKKRDSQQTHAKEHNDNRVERLRAKESAEKELKASQQRLALWRILTEKLDDIEISPSGHLLTKAEPQLSFKPARFKLIWDDVRTALAASEAENSPSLKEVFGKHLDVLQGQLQEREDAVAAAEQAVNQGGEDGQGNGANAGGDTKMAEDKDTKMAEDKDTKMVEDKDSNNAMTEG